MELTRREELGRARRIVVKIGSSTLTRPGNGLDEERLSALATGIAALQADGRRVIVVSSGATAAGRELLGLSGPPRTIPLKQAAAAAGQRALMDGWERALRAHGFGTAQILLTRAITDNRARFVNARNTLETLLRFGMVPIVNENDTVAVDELRFGDNDQLSAMVTNLVGADALVLLTDTNGLFTADPNRDATAKRIPFLARVDDRIRALAGDSNSDVGRGGMRSKVDTAAMAAAYGVATVVAQGRESRILERIIGGEDVGTFVAAHEDPLSSRKHWIAYSAEPKGNLVLDAGAVRAILEAQSSLLPSGLVAVSGEFGPGDPVRCLDARGQEIARGLTNYGVDVLVRLCGLRTDELRAKLGEDACEEAIHRTDLVVTRGLGEDA